MENTDLLENEIGHQICGVRIKFYSPHGKTSPGICPDRGAGPSDANVSGCWVVSLRGAHCPGY